MTFTHSKSVIFRIRPELSQRPLGGPLMDNIDREVVWNEVFEVWNTLDLVFEDLRKLFSEEPTSLRYIYEILWILGENS